MLQKLEIEIVVCSVLLSSSSGTVVAGQSVETKTERGREGTLLASNSEAVQMHTTGYHHHLINEAICVHNR